MKILLTSTSFEDTIGKHHVILSNTGFIVDKLRGPLKEDMLLSVIGNYDGLICGDDEITETVIRLGKEGKLKAISKYGIGLDKIDLNAAQKYKIPVANTPGVNHVAVAEHTFSLMLSHFKNLYLEFSITKQGGWDRLIGHEVAEKKIAIIGLGKIGGTFAKMCRSFNLDVYVFDLQYDDEFITSNNLNILKNINDLDSTFDIISLHMPLTVETACVINNNLLNRLSEEVLLINTSRAGVVEKEALIYFLQINKKAAYYTDVLWREPLSNQENLHLLNNLFITPHIGSRTYQSVERQGTMAVNNLFSMLQKDDD